MQVKLFLTLLLVSLIGFVSCSKEETIEPPTVSIEGKWIGKYSVLSGPYNNFYSFNFKAGGVLERLDDNGVNTGEGTWAFYSNNTAITGSYTVGGGSFSIIANFDKVTGKLDGTWGNGTNDYNGGYWFMNKTQ